MVEAAAVIKLRLNPDKETAKILDHQSKIANWLYNHLLEKANELRVKYRQNPSDEISKILYTKRGLRNEIPKIKKEHPFLTTVHSSPLKNSALRLSDAIQKHQATKKKNKKRKIRGWPKFRSWKAKWFSLFYDEPGKGYYVLDEKLYLSLGMVREKSGKSRRRRPLAIPILESQKLNKKEIRNLRIVKQGGVYSAVFTIMRKLPDKKTTAIGDSKFTSNSFQSFPVFIEQITQGKRAIDTYLRKKILIAFPQFIDEITEKQTSIICDILNQLLEQDDFDRKSRLWQSITLSKSAQKLISKSSNKILRISLKRKLLESAYPQICSIQNIIAFDPNHKNFAYGVDLEGNAIEIAPPIWLKKYDKRIDQIKAKRDRCKKKSKQLEILDEQGNATGKKRWVSSNRWKKYQDTLEKALTKRREQTKTFLFTLANKLYRSYGFVVIGDYCPNGGGISTPMRRAMNNRSLIGRFKKVMSWVALRSGKYYDSFNERGTTRTCCECKHKVKDGISPDVRSWICPKCQSEHIRDENAARNGLSKYLRELEKNREFTLSVSGSDPVIVRYRWVWSVQTRGIASAVSRGANCGLAASSNQLK